jgi:hypothetical protein
MRLTLAPQTGAAAAHLRSRRSVQLERAAGWGLEFGLG